MPGTLSPSAHRRRTDVRAKSGRFVIPQATYLCDLETVKRRVALTRARRLPSSTPMRAIAYDAMKAGSRGLTGAFTNFHPDLYKRLMTEDASDPALADELSVYLRAVGDGRADGLSEARKALSPASRDRSPAPTAGPSPSISTKILGAGGADRQDRRGHRALPAPHRRGWRSAIPRRSAARLHRVHTDKAGSAAPRRARP